MSTPINEVKEQLQQDILCLLEGMGLDEVLDESDWESLQTEVCEIVIHNLNKLN